MTIVERPATAADARHFAETLADVFVDGAAVTIDQLDLDGDGIPAVYVVGANLSGWVPLSEVVIVEEVRSLVRYAVTLDTPRGPGVIEVPTFQGPDAAGRRAHLSACAAGWGDLDKVTVASVVEI